MFWRVRVHETQAVGSRDRPRARARVGGAGIDWAGGRTRTAPRALLDAGLIKLSPTGCEFLHSGFTCAHPPCTDVNVSHAVVEVRKPNANVKAGLVTLGVLGGIAVVALLVAAVWSLSRISWGYDGI